ncbi:MAG: condensation domain-containing protein [Burkholderiales bacterium]
MSPTGKLNAIGKRPKSGGDQSAAREASSGRCAAFPGQLPAAAFSDRLRKPAYPAPDARWFDEERSAALAQQRLWFLQQLEPAGAFYNISKALRLRGELDPGALKRSFQEIANRHKSLRTAVVENGEQAVQTILPAVELPLPGSTCARCRRPGASLKSGE